MTDILAEMAWAFAGKQPNVPLSSELEVEEWRQADGSGDPANRPMFVTLPLLKVGTASRNGLQWDKASAMRVVNEINTKRPDGNLGHLPKEKRSTDFSLPVLRWLGAALNEEDGMVWAKAYVPKYAADVREFLADAKRAHARVGTSVYGLQGAKGLQDMTLESVDLGHPDRVSHPDAAAVPILTAEMKNESTDDKHGENKNPMANENELQLVSELTTAKNDALRQVSELTTKLGDKDKLVTEMQGKVDILSSVDKLVAEFAGATTVEKIGKLVSELADLRKAQAKAQVDAWIAEAIKAVELEALRPTIITQMGEIDSEAKAKARVEELLKRDDIKLIAEALAFKAGGPRAFVGLTGKDKTETFDESPEAVAASRSRVGI